MWPIVKRERGWSPVELTITLVGLQILCAIVAPMIGRLAHDARIERDRSDAGEIGWSAPARSVVTPGRDHAVPTSNTQAEMPATAGAQRGSANAGPVEVFMEEPRDDLTDVPMRHGDETQYALSAGSWL